MAGLARRDAGPRTHSQWGAAVHPGPSLRGSAGGPRPQPDRQVGSIGGAVADKSAGKWTFTIPLAELDSIARVEVDAQDHQPVSTAWVRLLGGAHNVPFRSRRTASESRQVLAFTVHTVRFENDLPELRPTRARNR